MFYLLILLIILLNSQEQQQLQQEQINKPIFLIHGIGSSAIMADISINSNDECDLNVNNKQLWINYDLLNPLNNECALKYLKLEYNNKTNEMKELDGIKSYYPNSPSVNGIANINDDNRITKYFTRVFNSMVNFFEKRGYQDEYNLFGIGYDWRFAQGSLKWKEEMKKEIINAYNLNNEKIVLVSHSMGGLVTHDLLSYLGKEFCDKYISDWIAISTPWKGSVKTLNAFMEGDNFGLKTLTKKSTIDLIRSFESIYNLFPKSNYGDNEIIVNYGNEKYSSKNITELINKYDSQYINIYKKYKSNQYNNIPNNVKMHCVYSYDEETISSLTYDDNKKETKKLYDDGDGTVNIESLKHCEYMKPKSKLVIEKVSHFDILSNQKVLDFIFNIVENKNEQSSESENKKPTKDSSSIIEPTDDEDNNNDNNNNNNNNDDNNDDISIADLLFLLFKITWNFIIKHI